MWRWDTEPDAMRVDDAVGVAAHGGWGIRRRCWVLAALMMVSVLPPLVHAQEAVDPQLDEQYQRLITDALAEFERGGWEESMALFRRAHEILPSARTLRGMGMAAYEARRYADCIRALRDALVDTRRPLPPKQHDEVAAALERAKLFVGYLRLVVEPASAVVTINGQPPGGTGDEELATDAGLLDIEATAEGYEPLTKRVRLNGGDHQTVRLHLTPARPMAELAPPPKAAGLASLPAAAEQRVSAPLAGADADSGGAVSSPYGTWKWVTGAAALAALGTGATLLIIQKSEAPSYKAECIDTLMPLGSCERRERLLGSTLWTGSIIGFSVGAGLAALSTVLFALDAGASSSEHASRFACAGEGTLGVGCRLQF
ncbi:MAG: PEGA domain-containing protein [Polyangiales bacterium]